MKKKLTTLALIIVATTFIQAQSNLVFNQALLLTLSNTDSHIVPQGKVWKIETSNLNGTNQSVWFLLNGTPFNFGAHNVGVSGPIWLPEGTEISFGGVPGNANSTSNLISLLEFNVVAISSSGGGGSGGGDQGSGSSNGSGYGDDYAQGGDISDANGNEYETVTVNGQTWTTSNLDVSTYRDGTPIPYISSYEEWRDTHTGAYTYATQNSENEGHGKIYNAWAIIGKHDEDINTPNKQLAPEGTHIPSANEWSSLINYYTNTTDHFFENFNSIIHPDAAWPHKSQTTWSVPGNNESGLNIKGYGQVRGSSSIADFGNDPYRDTSFWTSSITSATASPPEIQLFIVNFTEGYLERVLYGHQDVNPSISTIYTVGSYVRLIVN